MARSGVGGFQTAKNGLGGFQIARNSLFHMVGFQNGEKKPPSKRSEPHILDLKFKKAIRGLNPKS